VPAGIRAKLGLSTGDQIDLELVDGSITLRPHRRDADRARPDTEPVVSAEPAASAAPELPAAAAQAPVVKRGPGRPRKSALPVVPPTLKARGSKRNAAAPA